MRAISLWQPWASLMAVGAKRIETRSWMTAHTGPVAIHATAGFPADARDLCFEDLFYSHLFGRTVMDDILAGYDHGSRVAMLPRGAVVATATLIGCQQVTGRVMLDRLLEQHGAAAEEHFGDFSPGRWAWVFEDVRRLPEPVPAKGARGLWEWHRGTPARPAGDGQTVFRLV